MRTWLSAAEPGLPPAPVAATLAPVIGVLGRVVAAVWWGVDADDVRGWVRDALSRFVVPRDVESVDELPRNATGKVARRDLPTAERP